MLWGISKQQARVPRSPSHGPVKGVTINTNASVHCCGKKLLKSDIIKGHNLGPPSLSGSLKQAWFLSSRDDKTLTLHWKYNFTACKNIKHKRKEGPEDPSTVIYTGCNRRNGPNFGRVFLRSNYTDITQNTYIQSSMVTEILAREKCGLSSAAQLTLQCWRQR